MAYWGGGGGLWDGCGGVLVGCGGMARGWWLDGGEVGPYGVGGEVVW